MDPFAEAHEWCRDRRRFPLHAAVHSGSIERTLAVLARGSVYIDQVNPQERVTALIMAAHLGYLSIGRALIDNEANLSMADASSHTALHCCADGSGHAAFVELLIGAGANLEVMTARGSTPLHMAARNGSSQVVSVLIKARANPDSRMVCGATPLHIAAQFGHTDATRQLLRGNANPFLNKKVTRQLLRGNANSLFTGEVGPSLGDHDAIPMDIAAHHGHSDVVRELVLQWPGWCITNAGRNALVLATSKQHVDIMAILTGAGVVDGMGECLLGAAGSGLVASVKFLLRQRPQEALNSYVNIRNSDGCTPLAWSIRQCCSHAPRIVRLLIDAGADVASAVRVANSDGEQEYTGTPLAVATSCLREKVLANGTPATEEHLHKLEAIRRLLLQIEAVNAASWMWASGAPCVGHARPPPIGHAKPPPKLMLPPCSDANSDVACLQQRS